MLIKEEVREMSYEEVREKVSIVISLIEKAHIDAEESKLVFK